MRKKVVPLALAPVQVMKRIDQPVQLVSLVCNPKHGENNFNDPTKKIAQQSDGFNKLVTNLIEKRIALLLTTTVLVIALFWVLFRTFRTSLMV